MPSFAWRRAALARIAEERLEVLVRERQDQEDGG
jgi:hypothetical protein